jgi:hypothetical protein
VTTKTKTQPKPRNAAEAVNRITDAPAETTERDNRGMKVGDVAHQGDVYVVRVEKREDVYRLNRLLGPARERGEKTGNRQVAPGETMGSRHVVAGKGVTMYAPAPGASPLEGPTIEAEREWSLDHPEHARHGFGPGTYVVTFQRELAEEIRRVQD